jgi:SagB-type dehydrogenase family enzyme
MSLAQFSAIVDAATRRLSADFAATRYIQLYVYAHRVEDLEPGVYRHWPECKELERLKSGDQRVMAAGLSLGQELAGNACVAFSMIADLDLATASHGHRGYRYAHFEAGAIGHRMYLAAEALGFQATGIGAFFDDEVNVYLGLAPDRGQVIYHFAIGHAVADPRLQP